MIPGLASVEFIDLSIGRAGGRKFLGIYAREYMLSPCSSEGGNSGGGLEGFLYISWWGCIRYAVTMCALE